MAADGDDQQGVMGNLPRSRPGRRSEKRSGTTTRAKKSAPPKKRATSTASTARKQTPRARPQAQRPPRPAATSTARSSGGDPIGQAVGLAGKMAALGVRTAAGIVKRIPRP